MIKCKSAFVGIVTKLFDITGKALSGEWGTDDPDGCGIPVLRTTNFTNVGKVNYDNVVTRNIQKKNISDKLLKKGDIIIEKSGGTDKNPVGRVIYFEGEENKYLFNNFTGLLRVKDKNEWYPKYVFYSMFAYYTRGGTRRFENKTTGLHNLKLDDYIKRLDIQKASYVDQVHVCKLLDCVRLQIDNMERELELLDELIKARFVEMFGDPNIEFKYSSVKFNDLVARMTKGPFGSDMKKDLFVPKGEDTYKVYIQINAIQKNQSLGEYYISKEYFDRKVSRFELFPNDYIITCDGTLGKYLKLDENMEKGVISPSLLRLTLQNDKINDKYFENIWDFYMLGLMKKEARNACLVHLPSAKKIGEISIPVPPLELQNQFASFVEEVDKSRLLSNHSLLLLKSIIF